MRRISVVIPSFDHSRFVAEAIRSVAAQTLPPLELVVVDDGSTDDSLDVIHRTLDELGLPGARCLQQENRGAHQALARGIEATSGDVIAILNSDDRFHPERLAHMLRSCPERGDFLAFSTVSMIDAVGDLLGPDTPPMRGYRHALYEATRCPTVGFALLRNNIAVSSGNLVFTRTLYDKVGGFQPFVLAHDWDFLLQSLVHVEPILVPEPLLDYRTHGTNARVQADAQIVNDEGRAILRRYYERSCEARPANSLAPCDEHWPLYFDLFISRYHAWFGQGPLREWLELAPPPMRGEAWRSWADVVDADRVDHCDYLVDGTLDPARRTALALAREVILDETHPLREEEGSGAAALRQAFEREARQMAHLQRPPWSSPIERRLALEPPRPRATRPPIRERLMALVRRSILGGARRAARRFQDGILIRRSGVFDADYYRAQCSERKLRALDPVQHYLRTGAEAGLDPHPWFQTLYYLQRNPDVNGHTNPLVHFLRHGEKEGRRPHPLFDPGWYMAANPDVARSGWGALSHFAQYGLGEGRAGHPRFDPAYYRSEQLDVSPGENPWIHYLEQSKLRGVAWSRREGLRLQLEAVDAAGGAGPLPVDRNRDLRMLRGLRVSGFFDAQHYAWSWGADIDERGDAARHFLERGAIEGVEFCPPERLVSRLEQLEGELDSRSRPELAYLRCVSSPPAVANGHRVTLYVSSRGNSFFREMAELLALGFRRAGAEVRIVDEQEEGLPAEGANEHAIVIAPHEFFLLGDGLQRLSRRFLARTSLWVAEQPGSEFFAMCLWFARFARRVLDINPLTALVWGELGIPARALPLGWIDGFPAYAEQLEIEAPYVRAAQLPEARDPVPAARPLADRPIDVFYNGVLTQRREHFFAHNAWSFAEVRSALYMPTPRVPLSARLASSLSAHDATALSQRSRILLNIHRSEMPYFEWHRLVVRGFWQRTLVVSEPSLRVPGFDPGKHYVACELEEIPRTIEWLLRTDEGRAEAEAMRTRAFEALRSRYPLTALAAAFLDDDRQAPADHVREHHADNFADDRLEERLA